MTNPKQLRDLADRCEKATGPDRELDDKIAIVSGQYVYERRDRDRKEWFYPLDASGYRRQVHGLGNERLPAYTGSLDAAMTLVPKGMDWSAGTQPDLGDGMIAWGNVSPGSIIFSAEAEINTEGRSAALALCVTALRAQASMIEGDK